jgi:hypothetical protein
MVETSRVLGQQRYLSSMTSRKPLRNAEMAVRCAMYAMPNVASGRFMYVLARGTFVPHSRKC